MEYTILEGDHKGLQAKVNECLGQGWELYGHPYTMNNAHFQALVKKPTPKATETVKNKS